MASLLGWLGALPLVAGVGEERDLPCPLQSQGQRTLVLGAGAGHPPGQDLAAVADEAAQAGDLLVVDVPDLLHAEAADLAVGALRLAFAPHSNCHVSVT